MRELKFNAEEMRELEKFVLVRIEDIIFHERNRPSGKQKVKGGLLIEDKTGNLRQELKANRGFITQSARGFSIDIKMVPYFQYLDDGRRDELNWYLSEAIFEDNKIRDKIRELTAGATKRVMIKMISDANKTS